MEIKFDKFYVGIERTPDGLECIAISNDKDYVAFMSRGPFYSRTEIHEIRIEQVLLSLIQLGYSRIVEVYPTLEDTSVASSQEQPDTAGEKPKLSGRGRQKQAGFKPEP